MVRVIVSVLVLVLLGVAPAAAQPLTDSDTLAEVVEYVESERLRLGIPGMAVAVVEGDRPLILEGFGEASAGNPATPDTPFLINSISKSITAVAVAQLVEAGELSLTTDITDVIPELGPGGAGVTVETLLHHSAGIPQYEEQATEEDVDTLEATVLRLEPLFGQVDGFRYTNGAYDTLALVVERVSGVPFEQYVAANVFEPLGMTTSVVGRSGADLPGAAMGHYEWLILGPRPQAYIGRGQLLGGRIMYSTARDLAAYVSAHIAGSLGPDEVLYRGLVVNEEFGVEYAGGLWWEPAQAGAPGAFAEHPTSYHDGSSPTHRSLLSFSHGLDIGIVILANWDDTVGPEWIGPLSYNMRRILSGEEPEAISSPVDGFIRWSKWITLGIVVAQLALIPAVLPAIGRRRRGEALGRSGRAVVAIATLVDLVALGYLLWVPPNVVGIPLSIIIELPDYGLLARVMVAALAWGAVRTVLLVVGSPTRRDEPVTAP